MKARHLTIIFIFIFPLFIFANIQWLSPSVLKYGKIQEGKKLTDEIRFINTGDKPVEIERVRPSCGCTVTNLTKNIIAPNDTAHIYFSLNTMGFSGMIHKTINVSFKENHEHDKHFSIQANILRDLDISPRYIYITRLKVNPDTTIKRILTFCNNSDQPIEINKLFTESDLIELATQNFILQPNESQEIEINVHPKRAIHGRQFIAVDTNMPSKPHMNISVYLVIKE